ncbi:protein-tyrosine-phosphatase [Brumimicrobium glaciale]|uniref:Protein-tyrosine-phosphatase n=1 Tax=Brumimicrobium glaciale TaxID=200475 RepID=A0A4V1WFN8_9FLAO|nr:protein-tyrosine-phosphatase [Brumimicrobium glaciale]RYM33846.1 protein-tyrosine-phosphatase [Brumimicrobium glaciale]
MELYRKIDGLISQLDFESIDEVRKNTLQPLIEFIQGKVDKREAVKLNFICTHNSRRSHLGQIWAQTAAHYFNISNVYCYSGGTEATAVFPAVIDTLKASGFNINFLSDDENPKHAIKYAEMKQPIIGFSKLWDDAANPKDGFCALMTCSEADADCPIVFGAEKRVPIHYNDPKEFDNSPDKMEEYSLTSMKIANEMSYVFSRIKVPNWK